MHLREELAEQLARRAELASRVQAVLVLHDAVIDVEVVGSLREGKHDEFSDIDLAVHLRPDAVDRAVFFDLSEVLEEVGSFVPGWGFHALPDLHVGTFHFGDYPLFWGVDIACVGGVHKDGSDLLSVYRWEQIYKTWILAAKYAARGDAKLTDVRRLVERHAEVTMPASSTGDRLRALLGGIEQRKIRQGDPYGAFHQRCAELADRIG